jgi:hypothetical protein
VGRRISGFEVERPPDCRDHILRVRHGEHLDVPGIGIGTSAPVARSTGAPS